MRIVDRLSSLSSPAKAMLSSPAMAKQLIKQGQGQTQQGQGQNKQGQGQTQHGQGRNEHGQCKIKRTRVIINKAWAKINKARAEPTLLTRSIQKLNRFSYKNTIN